ncbi:unnamed protein product [Candida verbasci]|uniref:CS domain-containing protein n=1 Tax=Candida verbasci TaxID=1227364 RepID=A0A9W4X8P1_9ASCO|nr:unnamed protein product [Candida verbasci]
MITPFFTIDQDDEFIYVDIKINHIRFNAPNIEMIIDNDLFIFSLPPYYLRLRFPFNCIDDDERSSSRYDSVTECVKVKLPKENKGQFFPDLDLTAKLLARSNENEKKPLKDEKPLIEELDVYNSKGQQAVKDFEEGEQFDWEIKQEEAKQDDNISNSNKYGFNNQYDSIIGVSVANGNDINELGDPENTPETDRIIERLIRENIKFDPEIYAADYIIEKYPTNDDDKLFQNLINWKNLITSKFLKWYKSQQALAESERDTIMPVEFSTKEQEQMMNLPKKSYLIEAAYKPEILILIICLLFSYHFDLRENEGEHNIESAWTIGKITPQISFLDSKLIIQNDVNVLKSAIIICTRRALSYPLHKSWNLILKVWQDVYYNLRGGKRLILKSLLDLKELFRFHDIYYVYDKIWLQDLCSYLISDNITELTIRNLAHDFKKQLDTLEKIDIIFEKVNTEKMEVDEGENEEVDEVDEMVALNLQEIEMMADQSFKEYQEQQ